MKKVYLLAAVLALAFAANAQAPLTTINAPYTQNFNSLAAAGTADASTLPAGWLFLETGTNANTTYAAGTGSSNTGNTYSFGIDADRALGGLLSGSLTPVIGAGFVNQTGTTINTLQITYRGEQWRLGTADRGSDRLDFQYSLTASALNTGTWTDVNELDFSSPTTSGTVGLLNGNLAANSATVTFTIAGLTIAPGATFFIRWNDFNASGADDGLGIDDFSITPGGVPPDEPNITFSPASLAFGEVNTGTSLTRSYTVNGSNLDTTIFVSVADDAYALSTDDTTFSSAVILPASGGQLFVRFTPAGDGPDNTTIAHRSGTFSKDLTVTASGFDQVSHIIPIATARAASVGTKVTIAGRIAVANEQGGPAYVQDATGGIPVFDTRLANGTAIGDSVIVTGPMSAFNDQKEISGAGLFFTKVAATPRVLAPKPIVIADLAANEGLLVTVQQVQLVDKRFVFYPQSTEQITDGTIQADLRIDGDTDIPGLTKPQGTVDITGVVGRFKTSFQLLPRFQADIPGAAEPSTPSDSIPHSKTLDIVNWNFEFFGARKEDYQNQEFGPADEALQRENIRHVLDSLNADIIAVEEISNDSIFADLVRELGRYKATCSNRWSYSFNGPDNTFPPQKVCFIYDTTTIQVRSARALFEDLYDSARTTDPSVLPGYPGGDPSSFYSSGRLPYLLSVTATVEGVSENLSLIVIHAKSGDEVADRNRRAYDAAVLKDTLDAKFTSEKLIILGDLNDDLDTSITPGQPSPYAGFVTDAAHYDAISKTLSDAGARSTVSFNDVIDHQIITTRLEEDYLEGSVQIITPFRLIPNYGTTTSDHLPVISRYAFHAPHASLTQASATRSEDDTDSLRVSVVLDKPVTTATALTLSVSGNATAGSDYSTLPGVAGGVITLPLAAGDSTASFTFSAIDDTRDELDETAVFSVLRSGGIAPGDQPVLTITIEDNDVPVVSFAEHAASEKEGAGPYTVKLKLSTPVASDQTVTLDLYTLHNTMYGSDYVTDPAATQNRITVTIPAGSAEGAFTITPLEDDRQEMPFEPVSFLLSGTSEGLESAPVRLFVFTIIDVRKKHPQFSVFPNPTFGAVRLSAEDVDSDEVVHAELRGPLGELLLNKNGTVHDLNDQVGNKVHHGRAGIYTLKLEVDGENFVLRIVKL